VDESGWSTSRPSTPRSHNLSPSSNQSQTQGASFRALQFQSSSTTLLSSEARSGIIRVLGGLERSLSPPGTVQKSGSPNSLNSMEDCGEDDEAGGILLAEPVSAASPLVDFKGAEVDPDEDEYGEIIERSDGASGLTGQGHAGGGVWLGSSSSPTLDRDDLTVSSHAHDPVQHPPTYALDEHFLTIPSPTAPQPAAGDNRIRGDSISISTNGSANPQLSWSSTTATSSVDSGTVTTPATFHLTLPRISSPGLER
jgi:hypothetical protein